MTRALIILAIQDSIKLYTSTQFESLFDRMRLRQNEEYGKAYEDRKILVGFIRKKKVTIDSISYIARDVFPDFIIMVLLLILF